MRILVVYFSRRGTTEKIARSLARVLGADVEAIVDRTRRRGIIGYLRSGYEATFGRLAPIVPAKRDPWTYDLVIVGTPIWNHNLSSPVRSYLERHEFHKVAFFCTCGGRASDQVFSQMAVAAGVAPIATLVVRDHDTPEPAIAHFTSQLRDATGSLPPIHEAERDRAVRQ